MRINMLGTIEVIVGDRVIGLPGQRQRALLAALALQQRKPVPVGRLVDVLWATTPPPVARARIQSYVSGLRQRVAPAGSGLAGQEWARWPHGRRGSPPTMIVNASGRWRLLYLPVLLLCCAA